MKDKIGIIIPCLNEEESIKIFYEEINKISKKMSKVNFEFLFVDDGSTDNTLDVIKKLALKDKRVTYLSFTRNFGKEEAMYAGLKNISGNYFAFMDVDLQDPPYMLETMYNTLKKEDYDIVALYSTNHNDYGRARKYLTKCWYNFVEKITEIKEKPGARDFRLFDEKVKKSILSLEEYNRYTKGIFSYIGYKTKWINYDIPNRKEGKSKFTIRKLFKYAKEGILAFSTKPLIISAYIGLTCCVLSFIAILVIIFKTLIYGDPVSGWPSLACLIIFMGGIELFFFGIMGMYISKLYLEVKNRPRYIINETNKKETKEINIIDKI